MPLKRQVNTFIFGASFIASLCCCCVLPAGPEPDLHVLLLRVAVLGVIDALALSSPSSISVSSSSSSSGSVSISGSISGSISSSSSGSGSITASVLFRVSAVISALVCLVTFFSVYTLTLLQTLSVLVFLFLSVTRLYV